jgi:hypothetical protein
MKFKVKVYLSTVVDGDQVEYDYILEGESLMQVTHGFEISSFIKVPNKTGDGLTLINMNKVSEIYIKEEN